MNEVKRWKSLVMSGLFLAAAVTSSYGVMARPVRTGTAGFLLTPQISAQWTRQLDDFFISNLPDPSSLSAVLSGLSRLDASDPAIHAQLQPLAAKIDGHAGHTLARIAHNAQLQAQDPSRDSKRPLDLVQDATHLRVLAILDPFLSDNARAQRNWLARGVSRRLGDKRSAYIDERMQGIAAALDHSRKTDDLTTVLSPLSGVRELPAQWRLRPHAPPYGRRTSPVATSDNYGGPFLATPDGKSLIHTDKDGGIIVRDLRSGLGYVRAAGDGRRVDHLALSPDGRYVYSADLDGLIIKRELASGREVLRVAGPERGARWTSGITVSPDGRLLLVNDLHNIHVIDTSNGRRIRSVSVKPHATALSAMATSPDGEMIYAAGLQGIHALSTRTGEKAKVFNAPSQTEGESASDIHMEGLSASKDGRRVATLSQDGTVRLWSPGTGEELIKFRVAGAQHYGFALSADGRYVYVTAQEQAPGRAWVGMWDAATGREIRRFDTGYSQSTMIAESADGRSIFTTQNDEIVQWDVERPKDGPAPDWHNQLELDRTTKIAPEAPEEGPSRWELLELSENPETPKRPATSPRPQEPRRRVAAMPLSEREPDRFELLELNEMPLSPKRPATSR